MNRQFRDVMDLKRPLSPIFRGKGWLWIVFLILALYLVFSTFYAVEPDEVGVILRFGKYVRTTEPGLHAKIPFSIERLYRVKIKHIFKEEFGFRTISAGIRTEYEERRFLDESLMLTGDLNAADVEWIVQYKVKDARAYLFNVRNIRNTMRNVSETGMRQVVGDRSISDVLTVGRVEIGHDVESIMQALLDKYNAGVQIVTVKLQGVDPPDPVKPAFNEVNEARQEMERMINQAWAEYNKAIPKAKGEAEKTIRAAEGYAINRVNRSKGDAERFIALWAEYQKAKDVTKRRLYIEMMAEILPTIEKKYIIDADQKGILPFLDLKEEKK
jgi:membrane protease subunit HflK